MGLGGRQGARAGEPASDTAAGRNLILAGPPGVGKTTIGRLAAQALGREFVDGDAWVEARWGRPVADYFDAREEPLFRARERAAYRELASQARLVIAPGGGALLEPHTRAALEATGCLIGLTAPEEVLLKRLEGGPVRPLLAGAPAERLHRLLVERQPLYASFPSQIATVGKTPAESAADVVQAFRVAPPRVVFHLDRSAARLGHGLLATAAADLAVAGLTPPYVIVTDSNVGPLYGQALGAALGCPVVAFPAGEANKTLETVRELYAACLAHGLERAGTVIALGGGVVGDVAGFVAATLLRGVAWANLPTTLLAMADASLGGKVGVDLPDGKNLVGAFHPPAMIAADLDTLATLPAAEMLGGLAEVVKAAIIGDPLLFKQLAAGGTPGEQVSLANIARAAGVKVGVVNADPLERGERAVLNLGHTVGHGLEVASGYRLRHGEAVAIGLVAEARLGERLGLAEAGLADTIEGCLRQIGLPVRAPGFDTDAVAAAMRSDKKKRAGQLRFALPVGVGEATWGVTAPADLVHHILEWITHDPAY